MSGALIALAATIALSGPTPNTPAPKLAIPDLSGHLVSLELLRGQVVFVDFWATWCAPCRASLPHYQVLHEKYGTRGLHVVGVSVDDDRQHVLDFVKKLGLTFQIVHDRTKQVVERYDPQKMPTAFLIDQTGVIRHVYGGFKPGDEATIERDIQALLSAPK